jgi:hypothetical protein
VIAGIVEHGQQWIDCRVAVSSQNVSDPGCQPRLGVGQRDQKRAHRLRVGNPGQGSQCDLADVGVFGLSCLDCLEERRDRLGTADPPQQLRGKGAVSPFPGCAQLVDVLVHQAELVVHLEQPPWPSRRRTGLLLENRLECVEIVQGAHLMDGGGQQRPVAGCQLGDQLPIESLAVG